MTLDLLELLLSDVGQSALTMALSLAPDERNSLQIMTTLRKHYPPELASAAVELVILRKKAALKFRHAARMYFTKESLEIASSEVIARYRAERFQRYQSVGDYGCGLGGDTLALAESGRIVHAVDADAVRLKMTEANAAANGLADRVRVHQGDLLLDPLPEVPAAFADPGRRAGGQRFLSIHEYLPPPAELLKRLPAGYPIAFKLAPGVHRDELAEFGGELEFLSVNGELKESVLWLGDLQTTARRATLLPERITLASDVVELPPVSRPVGAFLYDPAAAVIRAELEGNLAIQLELEPISAGLAVFTSDSLVSSPFLTAYRVEAVLHLDPKRINTHLQGEGIGRVTLVQCGSGVDAEQINRKLKGKGSEHRFLILTKENSRPVAVVAERLENPVKTPS